jgi:GntR family transcriptional regulator of vanillate catabolism
MRPQKASTNGGSTRALSVGDRIRAAILSGDVEPGLRLHEERLCRQLGVSRTPVRAALQALASEGLLDYAPNRGYSVRAFQTSEIVDAYEIRAMLEGLACRFAAERGLTVEERDVLERALVEGDALLAAPEFQVGDRIAYGAMNARFHDTIHAASRCRMLGDMVRLCHSVPQSSNRNVVAFEHYDVRRRHDDHHRIHDALVTRDAARAEALMREHVASVRAGLMRVLESRADAVHPLSEGARPLVL